MELHTSVCAVVGVCWSISGWTRHPNEGSVGKLLKEAHQQFSKTNLPVDRK